MVLHHFNTHMQLYQLLADHIASFFEVRVVSIYRRCRDDYLLSWFHVLTFMMDVPFLAAWFSDAFFPSVWDGFVVRAL